MSDYGGLAGANFNPLFFFFFFVSGLLSVEAGPHVGLYICVRYSSGPRASSASISLATLCFLRVHRILTLIMMPKAVSLGLCLSLTPLVLQLLQLAPPS